MEGLNNINSEMHNTGSNTDPMQLFKHFSAEDMEKIKLLAGLLGIGNQQQTVKETITVEQGFSEYNHLIEFNLSKKSVATAKTAERRFLEFIPGNRALNTIERKDAENLMMKISKSAPLGCYNYLKIYRTLFNVFVDWNYIASNPFLKVKLPKRQKDEPVVFTEEQIKIVCERLTKKGKDVIADMVLFAVETGLRLDEENNLRWSDVDFRNKVITIGNKLFKTKSKKVRRIPFNERMERILLRNSNRQLEKSKILREFVFVQSNGKQYKKDTVSKSLKKVIKEAGLPDELHWHCLRATAATRWASNKVPIFTVSKLLGHSTVNVTTRYYAGIDLDELRDAVNRI
ncbi:tyrosine-type recombinase/integrase [Melioribacter sp. Ez-97]|uniref:tyrosine-type recombinase/integrase n=1 Tax=unclassified Melioribacter TaxID=2627329 RepID=UPI003ED88759